MAPIVKIQSSTGFIYEKNNFVAYVDVSNAPSDFHKMMEFINNCKLKYAMLESPTIFCEVVEEIWTTAIFDSKDETISFYVKGNEYVVNCDIMTACFKLPENNCGRIPNYAEIVSMLNTINYAKETDNLGKIVRKGMRKEWSFFCDAFIKVFSGKISNFDAITSSLLNMLYMLLNDKYFNFGSLLLIEMGSKLGARENRPHNIYYARFFMLLANHVVKDLVIENKANCLKCWIQDKRVLGDLTRMNLNSDAPLVYLPIFEVNSVPSTTSQTPISLPSCVAMEVSTVQLPPTTATKTKHSKTKTKKPTSSASQKTLVAKTTTQPEGSVKGKASGEGKGEHKRNPKDKVGEKSAVQPSHPVSSQKGTVVEKEISKSLVTSSQKDATIEKSSQPGTQSKRARDTETHGSPTRSFERRKKVKTTQGAQGTAHTAQLKIPDSIAVPSQIQIHVAPTNVESQPISLNLNISPSHSPTQSLEVDMISTSIANSPSLSFMEEPHSYTGDHHLLDDLLDHQPFISDSRDESVAPHLKSISTDSTLVSTSQVPTFTSSTDIHHPLTSVSPSTDTLNSIYPLTTKIAPSTDTSHPLITLQAESTAIETLLGMREGSDTTMSEGLPLEQAKGEVERQAISSSLATRINESTTLVGEGEGVRCVSQGEILMQENRENERKAGTGVIREAIASELMDVNEANREETPFSLAAEAFTHPNLAFHILARQGNEEAEQSLNLVHTTESMMRAKDAISKLPIGAGDDFQYGSEDEDSEGAGPSNSEDIPSWLFDTHQSPQEANMELLLQYKRATNDPITDANLKDHVLQNFLGTLKMQKYLVLQQRNNTDDIKKEIMDIQKAFDKKIDSLLPFYTMKDLRERLQKEDTMSNQIEALTTRVESIEGTLGKIVDNQAAQTALLQQLIQASTHNQTLDADKKGEKTVVATSQSVESFKGTKATTKGEHLKQMPSTEGELHVDTIASRLANSTGVSTQIIPVHTTTLKVLTPPIVLPVKKKLGEPSSKNEFRSLVKRIQSPIKSKGKNSERIAFPLPYPDEGKFLGQQIADYKNTNDAALKKMMAIIYRDGKQIHVFGSHPDFVEAKKEEAAYAKLQNEDEKKQQRLAQELLKELDDEMEAEAEVDDQPRKPKRNKGKSAARKGPRTKARAKRVKSPKEQVESTKPHQLYLYQLHKFKLQILMQSTLRISSLNLCNLILTSIVWCFLNIDYHQIDPRQEGQGNNQLLKFKLLKSLKLPRNHPRKRQSYTLLILKNNPI